MSTKTPAWTKFSLLLPKSVVGITKHLKWLFKCYKKIIYANLHYWETMKTLWTQG